MPASLEIAVRGTGQLIELADRAVLMAPADLRPPGWES
jgi:hypothetical protein